MNVSLHVVPDSAAIERNRLAEPEGERLRGELTEWLRKNGIVSILLDTTEHVVQIDIAPRLPDRIKSVLTLWGSIFVRPDAATQTSEASGNPQSEPTQKPLEQNLETMRTAASELLRILGLEDLPDYGYIYDANEAECCGCERKGPTIELIEHDPDCLTLAMTVLRKAVELTEGNKE